MHVKNWLWLCLLLIWIALYGCVTSSTPPPRPSTGELLLGKSSEQIVACAGVPTMHVTSDDLTVFRYYKEASLLEESSTTSKGSRAGIRHGCWATLLIENDRITGVEFRTVPEGIEQYNDECVEIFQNCVGF
jgi:hypothetical protein